MSGMTLKVVLATVLLIGTAAAAQTPPSSGNTNAQPERRICRSMSEPGALAGSRRVCMTRAEWDRSAEQARRNTEEMIAGRDSCGTRAEGGTELNSSGGPAQQSAAAMARMMGC